MSEATTAITELTKQMVGLKMLGLCATGASLVIASLSAAMLFVATKGRKAELFLDNQAKFRAIQDQLAELHLVNNKPYVPEGDELALYVKYWYFVFDEWYLTRSIVFRPLWKDVYAPAVESALSKGGFREGLLEYFGRSQLMGQKSKFQAELAPIYRRACKSVLLDDLRERKPGERSVLGK